MINTVTLTVPYEGVDRRISGSPLNIAKVALLVEMGLPSLDDMGLGDFRKHCDDADGDSIMGMGDGSGSEFVTGSHTLLMALQRVMGRPVRGGLNVTALSSKPYGTHSRRILARIPA